MDTFSRRIVGWSASTTKETKLVLDALEMALWQRDRSGFPHAQGELIHHWDAGSPYTSFALAEHPDRAGIAASIGVTGAVPGGTGRGPAWPHHRIDSARPLTGFAHGTAGIVTALARLASVAPDEGCAEAVAGGLAYDTEVFDAGEGNWPDFRGEAPSPFRSLWCHGAAGIGMSRLDLIGRPGTDGREGELAADPMVALRPDGPGHEADTDAHRLTGRGSDSMCHGDLGNLELVLLAERTGRIRAGRLMRSLGEKLDAAAAGDWVCGPPTRSETPGLMTGLAGVGHQLLRFANPDQVPSALLLHPPLPEHT
ncbi:hypothetical protein SSPO_078550 [Streptomyces antimycoticus]|uniref:Integrase catalytic domain-containing protein n=1 Tax=Streptomyces antimycoticus TaxID=68175 RepID=A0A499VG48_9ACTN|nr:hypothetical protein SSPO_078550 [Streptomyces antimycoticus]